MTDPRPGDWFVTPTKPTRWLGAVESWLIRWGQATRVDGRWVSSKVNHAGVYVGAVPGKAKPQILEAQPGGSRLSDADSYPDAWWSTDLLPARLQPVPEARAHVAEVAAGMVGIPYGFLDYLAVTLAQPRFGRRVNPGRPLAAQPWWVRRICSMQTAICSQLTVEFQHRLGVALFPDGWLSNLVTPQDLAVLLGL